MSPAARAAELVSTYGLKPDDLVVDAGGGGAAVLAELRRFGCRVLALDPAGEWGDAGIDTLRAEWTPAVERLVRERYGAVKLLLSGAGTPAARAA